MKIPTYQKCPVCHEMTGVSLKKDEIVICEHCRTLLIKKNHVFWTVSQLDY